MHVYDKNNRLFFLVLWLSWLLTCLLSRSALADAGRIIVLYPDIDPPYSAVFTEMIDGIAQRIGAAQVLRCALPADTALPRLKACMERQSVSAVITLGRVATHAYESSGLTLPHVIGALDLSPQTRPHAVGVSLAVDPALLFSTLKRLTPQIQRVFVVFNPDRERWIIERAQQAVTEFGLTLA